MFNFKKAESFKIAGRAGTVNQVYEYKSRQDKSRLLKDIRLTGPRYDPRTRKQVFEMEIKLPGGTP